MLFDIAVPQFQGCRLYPACSVPDDQLNPGPDIVILDRRRRDALQEADTVVVDSLVDLEREESMMAQTLVLTGSMPGRRVSSGVVL